MLFIFLIKKKKFLPEMNFKWFVLLLMLLPWLSSLTAYFIHKQPFHLSIYMLRYEFIWLLYFILHYFKLDNKDIIKIIFFFAITWTVINIIQQFTFPSFWFYTRSDNPETGRTLEIRMGIYRFMIANVFVVVFALFIYWQNFVQNKKGRIFNFLFFTICLVGVYLNMTRQLLFAVSGCLVLTLFITNKIRSKFALLLILMSVIAVVYTYIDTLFGDLISESQEQITSEDYIRYRAFFFFLFEYWDHWSCILIGNGKEHASSNYGMEMSYINDVLMYYRSDVGIVGQLNRYGVIYILTFFTMIGLIVFKFFKQMELYQKLYLICSMVISMMMFPVYSPFMAIFYPLLLYLIDNSANLKRNYI
jgi:hypothetical protein